MQEKGSQEERLGQQMRAGLRRGTGAIAPKSSQAAGSKAQANRAGAGLEEQGQGEGRAGGSCTVFWALYMRLRYS